ncbi:hypothetical protein WDU94_002693 [Cyamophila willieti]
MIHETKTRTRTICDVSTRACSHYNSSIILFWKYAPQASRRLNSECCKLLTCAVDHSRRFDML